MNYLKSIFALALLFFLSGCKSSQIILPKPIEYTSIEGPVSGKLTYDQSPYHVTGNLYLDNLETLVIEAGTKLFFADSARFIIRGQLTSIGTDNHFILYSAFSNHWKGISILNSSKDNVFDYSIIEDVSINDSDTPHDFGALEVNQSKVTIQHCIFRNGSSIQGGGLALLGATAKVTNNIFRENKAVAWGGAILSIESNLEMINNTIYKNYSTNYGGGLVLYRDSQEPPPLQPPIEYIQNNIFYQNHVNTSEAPGIYIPGNDSLNADTQYNFQASGNMNPQFISDNNFHLLPFSPCINAGNPHGQYNDPNGTANDQGAFGGPGGEWLLDRLVIHN